VEGQHAALRSQKLAASAEAAQKLADLRAKATAQQVSADKEAARLRAQIKVQSDEALQLRQSFMRREMEALQRAEAAELKLRDLQALAGRATGVWGRAAPREEGGTSCMSAPGARVHSPRFQCTLLQGHGSDSV